MQREYGWRHTYATDCDLLAEEIIATVGPSRQSLAQRLSVCNFVRGQVELAMGASDYSIRVVTFGSVPLRTCLWDADIDVAVIARSSTGQLLPDGPSDDILDMIYHHFSMLNSDDVGFVLDGVQLVPSRVRVLKLTLRNFVVDITVNKLAGTLKLPFLEQVDSSIGRGHLFKRSLLLIKAWMSHESRLLGSSRGLLATYALECMVICIFHLYGESLWRPVQVFHRFLEYYSAIDWQNTCISVCGSISKDRVATLTHYYSSNGKDTEEDNKQSWKSVYGGVIGLGGTVNGQFANASLMLGRGIEEEAALARINNRGARNSRNGVASGLLWLQDFREKFSYSSPAPIHSYASFPFKFINIIDPLNSMNNLGRSVTSQCFARFVGAIDLGRRQLESCKSLKEMFRNSISLCSLSPSPAVIINQSTSEDSDGVSTFNDEKISIYEPPHKPDIGSFTSSNYGILQSDTREIACTYLAAHPDPTRLESFLPFYLNYLADAKKNAMHRRRSAENWHSSHNNYSSSSSTSQGHASHSNMNGLVPGYQQHITIPHLGGSPITSSTHYQHASHHVNPPSLKQPSKVQESSSTASLKQLGRALKMLQNPSSSKCSKSLLGVAPTREFMDVSPSSSLSGISQQQNLLRAHRGRANSDQRSEKSEPDIFQ